MSGEYGEADKNDDKLVLKFNLRTIYLIGFRAVIFICYSPFSTDFHELARQNIITKQILEAFIQKKLGLANTNVRAPSIFDILPVKKIEDRPIRQSINRNLKDIPPEITEDIPEDAEMSEESEMSDNSEVPEDSEVLDNSDVPENFEIPDLSVQDYAEDDNLQSVESEQIDSIYSEGNLSSTFLAHVIYSSYYILLHVQLHNGWF
ncbi:unnamed protein product [Euphydryas editha]|uniref:Uncharacterized protein n=1 Tax=Euphydryas editha TaxID=104508 RepID=A0AAU9TVT9_EUPED|nr:unnamed protein product [Euphydryas editha]